MKIKDTVHFNWYKHLFLVALLAVCIGTSVYVTDADFAEVFGNLSKEDFVYIEKMAKLSPETKIYSNLEPTMIYYEPGENPVDIVIGKDAVYYHPEAAQLEWSDDIQPFGYRGVKHFFEECERVLDEKNTKSEEKNLKNSTKNIKEEKTLERGTN